MKSLMQLWKSVLDEYGNQLGTCTTRDYNTAASRFEHEGLSFLTITLPAFCSDLQKGLDRGWVDHDLWNAFSFQGGLPRFLGGFLDLVFDRGTGKLLDEPSVDAILALRQLTLMFGKILLPCSPSRVRGAIDGYMECEKEVRIGDATRTPEQYAEFERVSNLLFSESFSRLNRKIGQLQLTPKHGPGATAERILGNKKHVHRTWTHRLESGGFPAGDYILPSYRYHHLLESVDFLEPGAELPVRVITVPKTLKTPRIIAIEPVCMQYAQQALMEAMLEEFKRDDFLSFSLGFDDQIPNQEMARKGSLDGSLATLDLSEASDRVSNQLVRALVRPYSHVAESLDACRSRRADVPGHGVVRLAKFASMGSAVCFPVEASVFLTLVFMGIFRSLNVPPNRRTLWSFYGQVRVYGDDIIVPSEHVPAVVSALHEFGFKVNTGKSFWTGKFRESCGRDFYDGEDVSVVRVRRPLPKGRVQPTQQRRVEEVVSTVSLRNQLFQLGLWETCRWLDTLLETALAGHYPVVEPTSSVLGRESSLNYKQDRLHPHHHTPLVKGWTVRARLPVDKLDGEHALLKWFLKRGPEPLSSDHLERGGRADVVRMKLGWHTPY